MCTAIGLRTWQFSVLAALAAAIACGGSDAGAAQQKKRRRNNNQQNAAKAAEAREQAAVRAANAQIVAAKRVLAAAESKEEGAQSKLKSAIAGLRDATKEFDDAQSSARRLAKELTGIEQEILQEQPADSPYAKAASAADDSRQKLKELEDRLLGEKEHKEALAVLSGAALAERKAAILSLSSEYVQAKARLERAAADADQLRRELFRADDDWKETAAALIKARQEENAAEGQTKAGSSQRNDASDDLQQAKEAAATARAAIRKAEAVIARAKANDKRPNSQPKRDNSLPSKKRD